MEQRFCFPRPGGVQETPGYPCRDAWEEQNWRERDAKKTPHRRKNEGSQGSPGQNQGRRAFTSDPATNEAPAAVKSPEKEEIDGDCNHGSCDIVRR